MGVSNDPHNQPYVIPPFDTSAVGQVVDLQLSYWPTWQDASSGAPERIRTSDPQIRSLGTDVESLRISSKPTLNLPTNNQSVSHRSANHDDGSPTFPDTQLVVIGVCTSGRPHMLGACLNSLAGQRLPDGMVAEIVVVHNGSEEDREASQWAFDGFEAVSAIPGVFLHVPERGIAMARNIVLSKALAFQARWVAFIDDDEIADPAWLPNLMAPQYRSIPVLAGERRWQYPDPMPFWVVPKRRDRKVENEVLGTAATNNVRFSAALIHAGLRFDETLGMMGGEDTEFFAIARSKGFEIRRTLTAITYEYAHPERLTFASQVYRAYWHAASRIRRNAILTGWGKVIATKAPLVPWHVFAGACEMLVSPLFLIGGKQRFKRRALGGGRTIAKGIGRAAAIIGHQPSPYQTVVGR